MCFDKLELIFHNVIIETETEHTHIHMHILFERTSYKSAVPVA